MICRPWGESRESPRADGGAKTPHLPCCAAFFISAVCNLLLRFIPKNLCVCLCPCLLAVSLEFFTLKGINVWPSQI
jgi:hypothetical protein